MNLLEYLAIAAALLPVLYIWCKPLGVCAILLAFMVPGYIYVWAGLEIVTYLWSWALPLAAGLIVLIPTYRWVYIRVSRCVNGWSKLTMEVEDSRGHVHYIKRIDDQTYINGGSGSGKRRAATWRCAACRQVQDVHAAARPEEIRAYAGSLSALCGGRDSLPCIRVVRL